MLVEVNKRKYQVNENEFTKKTIQEFCNLKLLNDVGPFERLISLFIELKQCDMNNLIVFNTTHGGFLPIECSKYFDNISLINTNNEDENNINFNVNAHRVKNISLFKNEEEFNLISLASSKNNVYSNSKSNDGITLSINELPSSNYDNSIIFSDNVNNISYQFLKQCNENILIANFNQNLISVKLFKYAYQLKNTHYYIYFNEPKLEVLKETFKYCFESDPRVLNYDNLIHLCIMVKNGGPQFEDMLTKNLPIIDRWTILDTGSTDNTIDIINKVLVGKKRGELFQEPFINFRDSRNRCLELAGKACKYILMLDDTYVIEGNLRDFLTTVRGDQLSTSFSFIIKSGDVEYG